MSAKVLLTFEFVVHQFKIIEDSKWFIKDSSHIGKICFEKTVKKDESEDEADVEAKLVFDFKGILHPLPLTAEVKAKMKEGEKGKKKLNN